MVTITAAEFEANVNRERAEKGLEPVDTFNDGTVSTYSGSGSSSSGGSVSDTDRVEIGNVSTGPAWDDIVPVNTGFSSPVPETVEQSRNLDTVQESLTGPGSTTRNELADRGIGTTSDDGTVSLTPTEFTDLTGEEPIGQDDATTQTVAPEGQTAPTLSGGGMGGVLAAVAVGVVAVLAFGGE